MIDIRLDKVVLDIFILVKNILVSLDILVRVLHILVSIYSTFLIYQLVKLLVEIEIIETELLFDLINYHLFTPTHVLQTHFFVVHYFLLGISFIDFRI